MARKKKETQPVILAYKAFNEDFTCRGFQYEVGKTYEHSGDVVPCESGFHACTNPLDVLSYYDLTDSRFALVEMGGEAKTHDGDSKIAAQKITIKAELNLGGFIKAALDWTFNGWFKEEMKEAKDYMQNASSGDYTQNASSGDSTRNASSGDSTRNASSGDSTQNASSGDYTRNASSGDSTRNASSGDYTQTEVNGRYGITADIGRGSMVKGVEGTLVCLAHYSPDNKPVKFVTGKIGSDGLKPNIWYSLDENGDFVEVAG